MKLCKDCKHCVPFTDTKPGDYFYRDISRCAHPAVVSPVDGTAIVYCTSRRLPVLFAACGPKGKQWEPKS